MTDAPASAEGRRPSMLARALSAWGDLRGSIKDELAQTPSEPTVFAWLMIALVIGGLAATPAEVLAPPPPGLAPMPGMGFVVSVTLAPLVWYAIAALAGLIVRSMGGARSYREHRAIWFWQALVTLPVQVAIAMLTLPLTVAVGSGAAGALDLVGGVVSLVVLWRFYAASEDWGAMMADRKRMVLAVVYGVFVAILALAALLSALGVLVPA